jgi:hypothetical protein
MVSNITLYWLDLQAFRGIDESQKSIEFCRIRSRKTDIVIGPWRRLAVLSAQVILFSRQAHAVSLDLEHPESTWPMIRNLTTP